MRDIILNASDHVTAINPPNISGGPDSWITEPIRDRLIRDGPDGLPQGDPGDSFEAGALLRGRAAVVKSVDGASVALRRGESVGLPGESGCGETSTGRMRVRLETASAGTVEFAGQDIATLKGPALRDIRRRSPMIFRNPFEALNPVSPSATCWPNRRKTRASRRSTTRRALTAMAPPPPTCIRCCTARPWPPA